VSEDTPDLPRYHWNVKPVQTPSTDTPPGVSGIVLSILGGRGITGAERISEFLSPVLSRLNSPFMFADMERAAARVADAVLGKENVCIYGDYDADGMTSTALMKLYLSGLGLEARTFIPDRETDGYGLHTSRIDEIGATGVTLIVCVDCGIKSTEAALHAAASGIDLVILDHHLPGDELPKAHAIVDPHRADCGFPFKNLAAVGIVFYFCGALRRALSERGVSGMPDVRDFLDLVAIGTVADVMPLIGDNRILVKAGIDRINSRPRPGIAALKAIAGCRGPITASSISFRMAPRLNASGRMSSPDNSLNLLLSGDDRSAATWAEHLELANDHRREVEMALTNEARRQIMDAGGLDAKAVVVSGHGWHNGVLGIVASRLVEEFRVPAIVLSIDDDGTASGSARSVEGFDIGAALAGLERMLLRTGGHPMAAGLALDVARLDEFTTAFKAVADLCVGERGAARNLDVDLFVDLDVVDTELVRQIQLLEPFGTGNPEPILAVSGAEVVQTRRVGRDADHLKLSLRQKGTLVDGIWFGAGQSGLCEGELVDVAFNVGRDGMTGAVSIRVRDARPAQRPS